MKSRLTAKVLITLLIIFVISAICVGFYAEYAQIAEIGKNFMPSYTKDIITRVVFLLIAFLVVFISLNINKKCIRNNLRAESIETITLDRSYFSCLVFIISAVFALILFEPLSNNFHQAINSVWVGRTEQISGLDISFFLFIKPFIETVIKSLITITFVNLAFTSVCYFLFFIDITNRNIVDLFKNKRIYIHLSVILSFLALVIGAQIWISSYDIVYGEFAGLTGGGFVDVNIKYYWNKVVAIVLFAGSIFSIFTFNKNLKTKLIWPVSFAFVICLGFVASFLVQSVYVSPNEVMVEYPYIKHNIDFTRYGYNLENVQETAYEVDNKVSKSDFQNNDVVDNTRIIDFNSTITATNQLQGMRNYYNFSDIDVATYEINGKKELVAVGVREMYKSLLEKSARNYTNEKLKFTHGYGAVMMATNKVTSQGEPYYYIKDMHLSNVTDIEIKQPRIYYGENDNSYSIVNTKTPELDYSEGTVDHEFHYDGNSGIKLNMFNRTLFSFKFADYKMLITNQIHSDSKLLLNTNIIERVNEVVPFLKYDSDPKAVIENGEILWVIDGYTYTDKLPYSESNNGYNYIRNSVKAVVNAYNGETKFYIIDKNDPLIQMYKKVYPDIFETEDISSTLIEKSGYPEYLFKLQSKIFALYHNEQPTTFYNKNDMYAVANEKYNNDIRQIEPYYNFIQLNEFNKDTEESVLMLPYTMYNRDNMVSWIAVGNQGANYGKIVSYKFPKNVNIYGPLQMENLIDNDPEISKELTLWNSQGGNVIRGNLLVIPVSGTILYVEPVYLNSNNQAALPVLQRVIVALGDRIAMDTSIEKALNKVLDKEYVIEEIDETETEPKDEETLEFVTDEYIEYVIKSYYELEESASKGDWSEFGINMDKMKESIQNLEKNYK